MSTQKEHLMRRQKMNRAKSERVFSRSAGHTHAKNIRDKPMRGGIRL